MGSAGKLSTQIKLLYGKGTLVRRSVAEDERKKNWFCLVSKNVCKEQFFSYNIQVFFLRLPTNLPVPDKQI